MVSHVLSHIEWWKKKIWIPDIGIMVKVFASGPGRVIPKTLRMVLDATLLNTQHYKVRIKVKVEQSRKRSRALLYTKSYRTGCLRVTLDYGRNFTLLEILYKLTDCRRGRPEGSLFNSYYSEVLEMKQLLSTDYSTLPLKRTLSCWVLSKVTSSTIFLCLWYYST